MSDFRPRFQVRELPTFDPPIDGTGCPRRITKTGRIGDNLYVAGQGPKPSDVMIISTSLNEEDAAESIRGAYGRDFDQPAMYLKSPSGVVLKNILAQVGLTGFYFTAMCKWLLPKPVRTKPKTHAVKWAMPALLDEIKAVKPKIIVCMGKAVFDQFVSIKLKLSEIEGGWFRSEEHDCLVYPMEEHTILARQPDYVEKFFTDFTEVRKMRDELRGIHTPKVPLHYRTITNSAELRAWVNEMLVENVKMLSVDCEWNGIQHIDGQLRSIQFCWKPGHAVYVRFMDEAVKYVFDCSYKEAGAIIRILVDQPGFKYIGHQIAADFCWMQHVLGLDVYKKAAFDTLYAQQCVDENEDLKLERLALKYTDLGRYDIELIVWKKTNKLGEDEGYGRIPDSIIIPYGCRDVDTVMRAYPALLSRMAQQGPRLVEYYFQRFLPFVSDIFTNFSLVGLPINLDRLDALREMFLVVKERLQAKLLKNIVKEADKLLLDFLIKHRAGAGVAAFTRMQAIVRGTEKNRFEQALGVFKECIGPELLPAGLPTFEHWQCAPQFNIRSQPHMKRWLFGVKGITPIKSTNNKEKGMPSIPWEKVLSYPPDRQKLYSPSIDKQSLKVFATKDPLISELLDLNAVGNLTKAFLRPAEVDDEGNLVREQGLHFWVASNKRVHGQFASTETGRPRAWKPNSLNWPSYVLENIGRAIGKLVEEEQALPVDQQEITPWVIKLCGKIPKKFEKELPSIRSAVDVSQLEPAPGSVGWCIVESDFQTAEVRGLAFISGDKAMISLVCDPDPQFGILKGSDMNEPTVIRLNYGPKCGIPPERQQAEFIMVHAEEGKIIKPVSVADLMVDEQGQLIHPRFDKHWALAEMTYKKPREIMKKKVERGAGKVGNFATAYGASPATLERKIESDTGTKPAEGTGQALLDALKEQQPVAENWLLSMESVPLQGFYQAYSGRIRHFSLPPKDLPKRERERILSGMSREARNYPIQHSVANIASQAAVKLTEYYIKHGMTARVIMVLYDSVVTVCAIEERFIVRELHERFMNTETFEVYHGRELHYPCDHEFNYAWSYNPGKEARAKLNDKAWNAVPKWLAEEVCALAA